MKIILRVAKNSRLALAAALSALLRNVELRDVLCFGGLAMLGYGLYLVYPPACWVVIGGVLHLMGRPR